ncbi:MAG: DUF2784 family protein [bacterium]|nr:DUF2784 family protein [bacterium]
MGAWVALAVAIALVHGLGIVFLIAGAPLSACRRGLMRWYLLVLAPTAAINLAGQPCPLTVWEKHFWRLAGETPYRGGFVSRYFVEPFHPPGLRAGDETVLLIAVVVWCLLWLLYAAVRRLRLRSGPIPRSTAGTAPAESTTTTSADAVSTGDTSAPSDPPGAETTGTPADPVPDDASSAATGLLVDESTADGRTTTTWRMDDPMATYVAAIYVGDFERVDRGRPDAAGPLLRDYVPGGAAPEVGEALTVTSEVIAFIEEILGPYPFEAYGTLVLPFDLGFALENQTLPVHGLDILSAEIIAHEAAHQWVGNSVALERWDDIWLNEGFATYLHLMFAAEHYGFDFHTEMRRLHRQLPSSPGTPPKGITLEQLVGPSVYFRGAMTLHALRLHAGDETFSAILRAHDERSAGGTTDTEEYLGIVDEFAGSEAVDLVESWLHDETVPDLPEPQVG